MITFRRTNWILLAAAGAGVAAWYERSAVHAGLALMFAVFWYSGYVRIGPDGLVLSVWFLRARYRWSDFSSARLVREKRLIELTLADDARHDPRHSKYVETFGPEVRIYANMIAAPLPRVMAALEPYVTIEHETANEANPADPLTKLYPMLWRIVGGANVVIAGIAIVCALAHGALLPGFDFLVLWMGAPLLVIGTVASFAIGQQYRAGNHARGPLAIQLATLGVIGPAVPAALAGAVPLAVAAGLAAVTTMNWLRPIE